MEQRRLRLGDILDDYCPRERRVTNHAVVAMIEEDVKQTRCTTCDAEHVYKGGKAPRRKKKDATGALYKEVLAGITDAEPVPILSSSTSDRSETLDDAMESEDVVGDSTMVDEAANGLEAETHADAVQEAGPEAEPEPEPEAAPVDEGPVHRQLIRATLPRPEGQKDTRPLPEFTIRSRGNGNFRGDNRGRQRPGGQGTNGHRGQGGQRFASPRGGSRGPNSRSQGGGFRPSQGPRHGGKKRSR